MLTAKEFIKMITIEPFRIFAEWKAHIKLSDRTIVYLINPEYKVFLDKELSPVTYKGSSISLYDPKTKVGKTNLAIATKGLGFTPKDGINNLYAYQDEGNKTKKILINSKGKYFYSNIPINKLSIPDEESINKFRVAQAIINDALVYLDYPDMGDFIINMGYQEQIKEGIKAFNGCHDTFAFLSHFMDCTTISELNNQLLQMEEDEENE